MDDGHAVLWSWLMDHAPVDTARQALADGVVLDTWINGDAEEQVGAAAETRLVQEQERWVTTALTTGAIFPARPMPDAYVRTVFHDLLFSTALYAAHQAKGRRTVDVPDVEEAAARLRRFVARAPAGLTAAGVVFFVIATHEDLNAIAYYGRMAADDFLHGRLHRPWSPVVLQAQLALYHRLGWVDRVFTGTGDMLTLTDRGRAVVERLRHILAASGELAWRADNQRWAVFGEMDYDTVLARVAPDANAQTAQYLKSLGLRAGMRVLEVGCGTGRATVDLGLADLVGPGGMVVALDPSRTLLDKLEAKIRARGIRNVQVVQGIAEALPFPAHTFDAAVAVAALHFTDVDRAVAEMARVTKPGGLVSALCPPPEFDVRTIPMVALWFRPLTALAERLGVPFGEKNGLPRGRLQAAFARHLTDVVVTDLPRTVSAEDYRSFLTFVLKGAAFFQNILCRLPYHERGALIQRLEETGAAIAAHTTPAEKQAVVYNEAAYGRVPGA